MSKINKIIIGLLVSHLINSTLLITYIVRYESREIEITKEIDVLHDQQMDTLSYVERLVSAQEKIFQPCEHGEE